jgi:putative tryptophan/tyrosine transport system substrate-binding protein
MKRRAFIAGLGAAAAWPLTVRAQQRERVWRLGVLTPGVTVLEALRAIILPELAKQGFVQGRNLVVDVKLGAVEALPQLARELAATAPDVIIAVGGGAIRAVLAATTTTPIVGAFIGEDPVAAGFAASLARPGGTVTGVVMLAPELDAKRLDVLHDAVPGASLIAALAVDANRDAPNITAMQEQARRAGLQLRTFYAAAPQGFSAAFRSMSDAGVQAVAIVSAPELAGNAGTVAGLAIEARLPTICEWPWMAKRGCLIGYGPIYAELHSRTADYVSRILHGASAGNLPMEQPTHFSFTINTKTARSIGLELPPGVLVRADEVIE